MSDDKSLSPRSEAKRTGGVHGQGVRLLLKKETLSEEDVLEILCVRQTRKQTHNPLWEENDVSRPGNERILLRSRERGTKYIKLKVRHSL